jgi:GNAT superfamily N-acetyltransferase
MLEEINVLGSPILNTEKTRTYVTQLLVSQYNNGNELGYAAYIDDEIFPVAYSLVFENIAFDLKYRMFNGLGLYVEPEHRGKGLGTEMIRFTLDHLREIGCKKFVASFIRESSNKVIQEFGFEQIPGSVWLNL